MADFLKEIGGQLDQALAEMKPLFEKKDANGDYDWDAADVEKFQGLESKARDLRQKHNDHAARSRAEREAAETHAALKRVERPGMFSGGADTGWQGGSQLETLDRPRYDAAKFAKSVVDHPDFKEFRPNRPVSIKLSDVDFGAMAAESKTVMTTAAGFAPPVIRNGVMVDYAVRRPMVGDLIPTDTVGPSAGVTYMEETTWTNNAAPVAEGASKPESANAWTQRTVTFEVIATTLPVTEQQLADIPAIEAIIRNRMTRMVLLAEEDQLLNGTGTSPSLQGFLTKTGVQVQAAGSDPTTDALLKAMTLVMVTGRAAVTGVVMHPTNYMNMRLLRTSDGIYIFGNPAGPIDTTIWGVTPVVTDEMTLNTALLGDFRGFSHISRRNDVQIDIGFVNDDFKRNQRTIRCEIREALEIYRAAAFAKVTGLV